LESKEYSWAWVTGDQLLTDRECELVYACLSVSGAETDTHLRHGTNTGAGIIVTLKSAVVTNLPFSPLAPIYCPKGLFADIGSNTSGLLVIWRNL